MNQKELNEFKTVLKQQHRKVKSSKYAAKELLVQLGMLTPKGNLKKAFRSPTKENVSR